MKPFQKLHALNLQLRVMKSADFPWLKKERRGNDGNDSDENNDDYDDDGDDDWSDVPGSHT